MNRTLYHNALNPFSRSVRIQLKEKAMEASLVEVKPWERPMELIQRNPACEVPVLVEASGLTVSGHYAVVEYLEDAYPERGLLGKTAIERAETRRLVDWFAQKFFAEVTRHLLYEKHFKRLAGGGGPMSDAIRAGKANILYHLEYIAYLSQRRGWLVGDQLSMADIVAASQLSSLDYFGDVPWAHSVEAKEWYALVKSRPSFRQILADYVAGQRPAEHYNNLDF